MSQIRAVVYDLDGTIVDTEKLHEDAWHAIAQEFGIQLTPQQMLDQKGIPNIEFARMVVPPEQVQAFAAAKKHHAMTNLAGLHMHPGFLQAIEKLRDQGILVWICTSSGREFTVRVLEQVPEIQWLKDFCVTNDMYSQGKPSAEPLTLTLKLMGIASPSEAIYVGDAYTDYCSAWNAGMRFVHFFVPHVLPDPRMPELRHVISDHREILPIVQNFEK